MRLTSLMICMISILHFFVQIRQMRSNIFIKGAGRWIMSPLSRAGLAVFPVSSIHAIVG